MAGFIISKLLFRRLATAQRPRDVSAHSRKYLEAEKSSLVVKAPRLSSQLAQ
jgi:hypothetical protein